MKRAFDFVVSLVALVILFPFLLLIALLVAVGSPGGAFFKQERVGVGGRSFSMFKFRSMRPGASKDGLLSVGKRDPRVTGVGQFLRKTKLDELPQLINVLKGDMSLVGPRPEVPRYVAHYTTEQRRILSVRPGITDNAALDFINESEVLAQYDDPEKGYLEEIMPKKLDLYLEYIDNRSFFGDIWILVRTAARLVGLNI
jgi:lipopolysaccharide/colanic/teichoic acid biosynthesis glycosyltransferase